MGGCPENPPAEFFVLIALFVVKSSFLRALRVLRGEYSFTLNPEEPEM
jgi:hypothetical protein